MTLELNTTMKNRLLLWFATGLFWMGDLFSKLSFRLDSRVMAALYLWFMNASVYVQDKYNLDGPWQHINQEQE